MLPQAQSQSSLGLGVGRRDGQGHSPGVLGVFFAALPVERTDNQRSIIHTHFANEFTPVAGQELASGGQLFHWFWFLAQLATLDRNYRRTLLLLWLQVVFI